MKIIGITGGVGAGKSEVLKMIAELCSCRIIIADEAAHQLEEPGEACYQPLLDLLGAEILNPDQTINKQKMAAKIFEEDGEERLKAVNQIIHPAVKQYITAEIEKERTLGQVDYFWIEAALLIEDGYTAICDELWYIYAKREIREQRLKESRGYSDEKIAGIMKAQSDEETFRKHCRVIIDNSGDMEQTRRQLRKLLQSTSRK